MKGLRAWMDLLEVSVQDLAERTGLTRQTIYNVLEGQDTSQRTIDALRATTGLSYEQLLGESRREARR